MSGNSLSNFSISSSPVTFTSVTLPLGGGVSKSSNENPFVPVDTLPFKIELVAVEVACVWVGMSSVPSREMSGNAEAARSNMSSPPAVANESPVGFVEANSEPRISLSRWRKSDMVGGFGVMERRG